MIELAILALSGWIGAGVPQAPTFDVARLQAVMPLSDPADDSAAPAVYRPEDKSVSTWRRSTRLTLEPAPLAIAAAAFDLGRPVVARCVKLNNPWCIKRARWAGEVGGDDEGHTAFASTEYGADAAAALLRTYYVSLGRKSALDIVRRWAPAECGIGGLSIAVAVGGLAGTLRARFIAANGGRRAGAPTVSRAAGGGVAIKAPRGGRVRVSVVPLPRMPSVATPSLMTGMAAPRRAPPPPPSIFSRDAASAHASGTWRSGLVRSPAARRAIAARARAAAGRVAARPATPRNPGAQAKPGAVRIASVATPAPLYTPRPLSCGSDEARIQSYASAIAKALGTEPSSDLKLFDEAGSPTVNLLPVLVAMSAVELGYLHAGPELAEGAVERLRVKLAAAAEAEAAKAAVEKNSGPEDATNRMNESRP